VAAIGLTSWDRILVTDFYPEAGEYAIVRHAIEQSGGTTANTAHALSRIGIPVTLAAMVGDDREGQQLRQDLTDAGCDVRYIHTRAGEPSDSGVIIVSGRAADSNRTIFWQQGARLRMGDALAIDDLFAHDLVYLDVDDQRLRRFIVDLPMHVSPRTRLLGSLTYLVELSPDDAFEIGLQHNYLVGNERELRYVTGMTTTDEALERLQTRMTSSGLMMAAISCGSNGCVVLDRNEIHHIPGFKVDVVDTTGAGDAFAAGIALGIIERRSLRETGLIGNAMGALSIRALGARAGLPTRDELDALLADAQSPLVAQ
jgi:ribokinase